MNPNRHQAFELRRRTLADQVSGLEARVAGGDDRRHVADRLADTQAELEGLGRIWAAPGLQNMFEEVFGDVSRFRASGWPKREQPLAERTPNPMPPRTSRTYRLWSLGVGATLLVRGVVSC